jgi:hypothetical protein
MTIARNKRLTANMPPTRKPPGSTGNGFDDGGISGASLDVVVYDPSYVSFRARTSAKRVDISLVWPPLSVRVPLGRSAAFIGLASMHPFTPSLPRPQTSRRHLSGPSPMLCVPSYRTVRATRHP